MAKRDPELTARNKLIANYSEELDEMLESVLALTGLENVHSLHGKIGSKFDQYLDIKNDVITSQDHFVSLWLEGLKEQVKLTEKIFRPSSPHYKIYKWLERELFQNYLFIFLKRMYLRNYDALTKMRPAHEDSEIWIGQNNASYGLLITPRFNGREWENDNSEIRHFHRKYWSIGHVLETGLVVPGKNSIIKFKDIDEYLNFFLNVIVRNSGSDYEYKLAELYCFYVSGHEKPEDIPLLIPEFRFDGRTKAHKFRLDFTIIQPNDFSKVGFELSPWSSHGYIGKTKGMTNKEINAVAQDNFEKEMSKHKAFFKKHGIVVLIYTDNDLEDLDSIFADMSKYLRPRTAASQIKFHILNDFFKEKL